MAKSFDHLWPTLISWENLLCAYRKCRRRKRYKKPAIQFEFSWESNLRELQEELATNRWRPGDYHNFKILEPKPRLISAAPFRDRIVHHALVNVLEPLFERRFIFDSYACRKHKGTHRAVQRAQYYLRRHAWYLKTDVVQFFPNVDHEILLWLVAQTIRDRRVLTLLRQVAESGLSIPAAREPYWFVNDDLLAVLRPCGLPIGNLTSQFLANVYLDPIDHFVKETLRVPGYVRYADDLLLFGDSKNELWTIRRQLVDRLSQIRLRLHEHKTHLGPASDGVKFLGFRLFPNQRRMTQTSIRRFRCRVRKWQWAAQSGTVDHQAVRASINAWLAHSGNCNSLGLRKDLMSSVRIIIHFCSQHAAADHRRVETN